MTWVAWTTGIILTLATWGTIYRIWKGPTLLDRVLASDVLLSVVTAALCILMITSDSTYFLTVLLAIALIGFVGSVTVARFADNSRADENVPVTGRTARFRPSLFSSTRRQDATHSSGEDTDDASTAVRASKDQGE